MNVPGLIHPNLMANLTPVFYDRQITLQRKTETRDAIGGVMMDWEIDPDYVELECAIAPTMPSSERGVKEQRRPELTIGIDLLTVSIPQYLPEIDREANRAVIDDVPWNILGVEWPSHQTMTRLALEKVTR